MHEQSSTPFYFISALELSREEQFHQRNTGTTLECHFHNCCKKRISLDWNCLFKRMTLLSTASDQNFSLIPTNPRVTAILVPRTSFLFAALRG